jgi:hypothetical protein
MSGGCITISQEHSVFTKYDTWRPSPEVLAWLKLNMRDEWHWGMDFFNTVCIITFKCDEDYLHFKLRWGDKHDG